MVFEDQNTLCVVLLAYAKWIYIHALYVSMKAISMVKVKAKSKASNESK